MASSTLNICLFLMLMVLAVLGENPCSPVQYAKRNLKDKPDLLVIERIGNQYNSKSVICRLDGNQSKVEAAVVMENLGAHGYGQDVEYDLEEQVIYRVYNDVIIKVSLKTGEESLIPYDSGVKYSQGPITSIALDWVTKNMYVLKDGTIGITNVKYRSKETSLIRWNDLNKHKNVRFKVLPNHGYFVIKYDHWIIRHDQRGDDAFQLYNNNDVIIDSVAVDHHEGRVYWVEKNPQNWQNTSIRHIDIRGGESKTFKIIYSNSTGSPVPSDLTGLFMKIAGPIQHIQVDEKYVYIKTESSNKGHFLRVHKFNGSLDEDFDVTEYGVPEECQGIRFQSITVLSNPQVTADDHPCKNNNPGCDNGFCVAVPDSRPNHRLAEGCEKIYKPPDQSFWEAAKGVWKLIIS